MRRDGRSLGQMARDEMGTRGGVTALVAVLGIMVILIAVLGLSSSTRSERVPWGTFTLALTIPIAMFLGVYLRLIRPHACWKRRPSALR